MAYFFLHMGKDVKFHNSSFCKTFLKQNQICTILRQKSCTSFVQCFYIFMSLLFSLGFDVDSAIDLGIFGF